MAHSSMMPSERSELGGTAGERLEADFAHPGKDSFLAQRIGELGGEALDNRGGAGDANLRQLGHRLGVRLGEATGLNNHLSNLVDNDQLSGRGCNDSLCRNAGGPFPQNQAIRRGLDNRHVCDDEGDRTD